jgi:hypothetical protein
MKRIRYVSRFARDLTPAEIDALAAAAAEQNARFGITGVLLTSGRLFFQIVEGPDDAIDGLLARIRRDDRHRDVFVLGEELGVRERDFPDWSMRGLHLDRFAEERLAPGRDLLQRLVACRRELDELSQELQQLIWNELSLGAG